MTPPKLSSPHARRDRSADRPADVGCDHPGRRCPGVQHIPIGPWVARGELAVRKIDVPSSCLRGGVVWLAERSPLPAALALVRELLIEIRLDRDPSLR